MRLGSLKGDYFDVAGEDTYKHLIDCAVELGKNMSAAQVPGLSTADTAFYLVTDTPPLRKSIIHKLKPYEVGPIRLNLTPTAEPMAAARRAGRSISKSCFSKKVFSKKVFFKKGVFP